MNKQTPTPPASGPPEDSPQQPRAPQKRQPGKHAGARRLSPAERFFLKLLCAAALLALVFTLVLGLQICRGNRMYPFIMDGDLVITYKLDRYRVGDAVAYRDPMNGKRAISRIAALGGNEVLVTEAGTLFIDGVTPDERVFYRTEPLSGADIAFPCRVPENGVFLLDDYRTQGRDSRFFGTLQEDELLGKVVYVFRRRGI